MRVLYLTNSAQIGGGNRILLTLWREAKAQGLDPVATCVANGPMVRACEQLSVPCEITEYYQPTYRRPVDSFRAYRYWRKLLREYRIELVHANGFLAARSIGLAAKRAGLRLVCHVHFAASAPFVAWVFRGLPRPDTFVFCSRALQEEMGGLCRKACPRAEQIVIHNCTDLPPVQDADTPARAGARRHRVGIVANLIPFKGHLDFLGMADLLTKRGMDAEYWIVGCDVHGSGYQQTLEQRARELGLQDRVCFLGYCADVPGVLKQLDVAVCASHVEPFGICLIEAMSFRKPVVATRVGGIPEVVEDGVTGILVPPAAPEALAEAVGRLLLDPGMRARMGCAGRRRVEGAFAAQVFAQKLLGVYCGSRSTEGGVC